MVKFRPDKFVRMLEQIEETGRKIGDVPWLDQISEHTGTKPKTWRMRLSRMEKEGVKINDRWRRSQPMLCIRDSKGLSKKQKDTLCLLERYNLPSDGKINYRRLGRELGISHEAARQRVLRLVRYGLFRLPT